MEGIGILRGASALPKAQSLPDKTVVQVSTNCDQCGNGEATKEDLVGMLQGPLASRVHYDPKSDKWQILYSNIG